MFSNIIAALALILAATSLFLQWRASRATLKVTACIEPQSVPVRQGAIGQIVSERVTALSVRMTNRGDRPVHVAELRVTFGRSSYQLSPLNRLYQATWRPFTVEPLRTTPFALDGLTFGRFLRAHGASGRVRLRILVLDEAGIVHKSGSLRFEVENLLVDDAA